MASYQIVENDLTEKLAYQSQEAIKTLIQSAELYRRNGSKSTNFFNSFFKEAKKHIS